MYIYVSNHLTDDCLPCPHSTRTTDLDTVMPSKTPTFAIIWPGWFGGFLSVPNGSVESRWVIVRLYQFIPAMNLQWITFCRFREDVEYCFKRPVAASQVVLHAKWQLRRRGPWSGLWNQSWAPRVLWWICSFSMPYIGGAYVGGLDHHNEWVDLPESTRLERAVDCSITSNLSLRLG